MSELLPSKFTNSPMASIMGKAEYEIIARNIMQILKRTGDEWRELSWDEYFNVRLEDEKKRQSEIEGLCPLSAEVQAKREIEGEKPYFNDVIEYCVSPTKALEFCSKWVEMEH